MNHRVHINKSEALLENAKALPVVGFWEPFSLAELAQRHGVLTNPPLTELTGDWPVGDSIDDFLKGIREGRR